MGKTQCRSSLSTHLCPKLGQLQHIARPLAAHHIHRTADRITWQGSEGQAEPHQAGLRQSAAAARWLQQADLTLKLETKASQLSAL